jgi:hypothetical protein
VDLGDGDFGEAGEVGSDVVETEGRRAGVADFKAETNKTGRAVAAGFCAMMGGPGRSWSVLLGRL